MAAPEDRVRLVKNESPSTGGTQDDEGFPAQLRPNQDAPSVRGLFLQKYDAGPSPVEDETVYISRDASGNMVFKDGTVVTEKNLLQMSSRLISLSFASNDGTLGLTSDSLTYELRGSFIWPGSDYIGTPASIKATVILSKAGTGYVRIYDPINGQIAVATTTSLSWVILDLGTLSNVAEGEAIWEIQLQIAGSPKPTLTVGALQVKF
jgi:hypothetical protein